MFARWLGHETGRRAWSPETLAQKTGLDKATVEAVFTETQPPDFEFCYAVAALFDKQPERVLNMAGLLSDTGLTLALQLAVSPNRLHPDIHQIRQQLSLDERRLLIRCAQKRGTTNPNYQWLRPQPSEFNKAERTQDRLQYALWVILLFFVLVGCSVLFAIILRGV